MLDFTAAIGIQKSNLCDFPLSPAHAPPLSYLIRYVSYSSLILSLSLSLSYSPQSGPQALHLSLRANLLLAHNERPYTSANQEQAGAGAQACNEWHVVVVAAAADEEK